MIRYLSSDWTGSALRIGFYPPLLWGRNFVYAEQSLGEVAKMLSPWIVQGMIASQALKQCGG